MLGWALATVTALSPLIPVFGLGPWGRSVAGGVGAAAAVAIIASGWRPAAWLGLAALVYLVASAPAALSTTAWLGVMPTLETIRLAVRGWVSVWKDVLTVPTPISGGGAFGLAPFALAYFSVLIAWRLARLRLAGSTAILAPLGALTVALVLGDDRPFSPAAMGALGAATGLAALAARSGAFQPRRFIACLAMAATMIGATFGGLALFQRFGEERLVIRDRVETPFDPSSLPSPLGAHRHYVRDLADTSVIEVEGLPSGVDIRLAVMDTFDGVVWSMSGPETSGSGAFVRPAATDDATADGADFEVQVSAAHLEGVWLPTCGNPVEFVFDRGHAALAETLRVNTATGTALLMDGLPPTLSYTQLGVAQVPPSESEILMASAATVPLPEASPVPDAVASAAVELTGQATTAGELAFALARGLRENGYFSDGAAVTGPNVSLAGHGYDRIKAFLEAPQMVGNSEQYASAMALMARSLGLSSRVVLGFSGSGVGDTAEARSGRTVFTGADLEAWVEVSLDQLGWVTFHPTPPKDKTVTESDLMQQQDPEPNRLQPPLPKPAQPAPPDLEIGDVDIGDSDEQEDSPPSSWLGSAILVAASVLGSMLVLTAPLVVIWLIKRLRRRRRSRASPATERIRAGWREIVDALTDLRSYPPPRSTRLEQAAALAERFDPDTQLSLVVLARAADEAQFAPFEQSDVAAAAYWDIWYQTERSILRQVGPRARWRFKISSRSLRRRGRRRA